MSVIEEVLLEEYGRSERVSSALEAELASLPHGSLRERVVDGRTYYYLQYRDGKHVRSDYVKREDAKRVRGLVARRKEVVAALKEQERSRKQIERALGRDFTHEHSGA
jgi:hypothetical protein